MRQQGPADPTKTVESPGRHVLPAPRTYKPYASGSALTFIAVPRLTVTTYARPVPDNSCVIARRRAQRHELQPVGNVQAAATALTKPMSS